MSDQEYDAVWPGTYGHFVNVEHDDEPREEPSWADIVLEQAIEEYLLKKAEKKLGRKT